MMDERDMMMKFRNFEGKQVAFHKAMHCLHRPSGMEHLCLCKLWRDVSFVGKKTAEAKGIETFQMLNTHPFQELDVAVCRQTQCVPAFAWNWLQHTATFGSSIFVTSNPEESCCSKKEECCKRFVILFMPFRDFKELSSGGSHQLALKEALKREAIDEDMLEVANNIQNICNSLNSELVDDPLLCDTLLEDVEVCEEEEAAKTFDCQHVLDSLGDCLASTSNGEILREDAVKLSPKFLSSEHEEGLLAFPQVDKDKLEMEDVFHWEGHVKKNKKKTKSWKERERHVTTTHQLNTLAVCELFQSQDENQNQNESSSNMAPCATNEKTIKMPRATGTWQSVVAWAKMAKLDPEQETAFQILTSTFVLTFCEEAVQIENLDSRAHAEQKECLAKLARRHTTVKTPLRMFVTGPAGAGKCECFSVLPHCVAKSNSLAHHQPQRFLQLQLWKTFWLMPRHSARKQDVISQKSQSESVQSQDQQQLKQEAKPHAQSMV